MIDVSYFAAFFLVFLRITTFLVALKVLFPEGLPNTVKIGLSAILSFFVMSAINYNNIGSITNGYAYIEQCACEVITGLALGYLTNLAFIIGSVAGQFLDIQIGFSMINLFDPTTQTNSTLLEKFYSMLGVVIFFLIDGHQMLIKALMDSYSVVHLGRFVLSQDSLMYALNAFLQFFIIGFRIALPIILVLMVTDIVLGLVSRTVPQLNVMIVGLPVKVLVGFSLIMFLLPSVVNSIIHGFSLIPDLWKGFYHIVPAALIFAADDKTEEATPKKKNEAKKKGQVPKSKDIGLALTLITSTIIISTLGDFCFQRLKNMITVFYSHYLTKDLTTAGVQNILIFAIINIAAVVLVFAVPIMIIGIFGSIIQSGFMFVTEPLKPDFSKLSPLKGLKKMFSSRTVVEVAKDICIVIIVGYIGYTYILDNVNNVLKMNTLNFNFIPSAFKTIVVGIFFKISIMLIVLALADYIYQRFMFNKDLKMSKQEIKEEYKQDEGDPHIKSKRKQKMREMSQKRMMASVPDATVIIANPTHISVALKYKDGENTAPLVVAKGADVLALKIKEIAKEHDIPIIENKPLARLIYNEVEIEQEIPMDMYEAVAEIMAIVYKMKKKK